VCLITIVKYRSCTQKLKLENYLESMRPPKKMNTKGKKQKQTEIWNWTYEMIFLLVVIHAFWMLRSLELSLLHCNVICLHSFPLVTLWSSRALELLMYFSMLRSSNLHMLCGNLNMFCGNEYYSTLCESAHARVSENVYACQTIGEWGEESRRRSAQH